METIILAVLAAVALCACLLFVCMLPGILAAAWALAPYLIVIALFMYACT